MDIGRKDQCHGVAELIAEGTSAPVVGSGANALVALRALARDSDTARAVEPAASQTENPEPRQDDSSALGALKTPLSVRNVMATQGVASAEVERPRAKSEDPINSERSLNAPLDPGDVSESRNVAREGARMAGNETPSATEETVQKASASGPKIVHHEAAKGPDGLTEEEHRHVQELMRRDREVHAHEQAHAAAGGPFVSAPRFRFVRGPDGGFYAASGEVSIDTTPVPNNPRATIQKMQMVKRAALAPQQPSAQDRRVAAEAERKIITARQQLREEEAETQKDAQATAEATAAEQRGDTKSINREQDPVFDPVARFRVAIGGTGAAPGTGLAGPGDVDVDASDAIDARQLFGLVA